MDEQDSAFVLIAAVLVLALPVGLVLLWGGRDRAPALGRALLAGGAVVAVLWILVGYAQAFGGSAVDAVGVPGVFAFDPGSIGLGRQAADLVATGGVSAALGRAAFFAGLAVAAVTVVAIGAGPVRRVAWVAFAAVWSLLVVFPQLGWVFDVTFTGTGTEGGWLVSGLRRLLSTGFLDFSGASAVHVSGGAAALALLLVLRRRTGVIIDPDRSEGVLLTGTALAVVGALAASGGAEGAADGYAALALLTTLGAGSAGAITGAALEWFDPRRRTSWAAARGLVAGLAAGAATGGSVAPLAALAVGGLAAAACTGVGRLAARRRASAYVHAMIAHVGGGAVGLLFLGFLATDTGLAYSGRFFQLIAQATGLLVVFAQSFVVAAVLGVVLDRTIGFRDLSGKAGAESRGSAVSRPRP
ncbi:MAG: Ammonium transporter NrgA [Naasia sp.]|nr:Ammonium transporter NrgA [Naasia sp.]